MILLKDESDLLVAERGALLWLQMMHCRFVKKIFAFPAVIVHPEDVQQRRFACTGRTHHGHEFAFGDIQIDIAQDVEKFLLAQRISAFEETEFDHKVVRCCVRGRPLDRP
jgi:hypothetical protein